MDKGKKKTLAQAKMDMDARVQEIRGVIAQGEQAALRLPEIREQLVATQRYFRSNCMYERASYDEGEPSMEDLECEVEMLQHDIECADAARAELKHAERFYRAYHYVVNGPKIRDLKSKLTAAEYWVEQWQSRIWAVDVDTDKDIDERIKEKEYLQYEYNRAVDYVSELRTQLTDAKNVRYM